MPAGFPLFPFRKTGGSQRRNFAHKPNYPMMRWCNRERLSDQTMRNVMRICTAAALATTLLSAPAFAQQGEQQKTGPQLEDELKAKRNAEIDKEYRTMRKHTQDAAKTTKTDPWLNMRAPTDSAAR